jgi:hypothetical protein
MIPADIMPSNLRVFVASRGYVYELQPGQGVDDPVESVSTRANENTGTPRAHYMLIARVHTYMEIRQHRGQQYKYRGHIYNFLCDSG